MITERTFPVYGSAHSRVTEYRERSCQPDAAELDGLFS
jgi:hypothetical protein